MTTPQQDTDLRASVARIEAKLDAHLSEHEELKKIARALTVKGAVAIVGGLFALVFAWIKTHVVLGIK